MISFNDVFRTYVGNVILSFIEMSKTEIHKMTQSGFSINK